MRIAALMNVCSPDPALDTIDSVRCHMTGDILVVIDEAFAASCPGARFPCHTLVGLRHGHPSAPYRNTALGLHQLHDAWPDADWYCCLEPDVLVASRGFEDRLSRTDAWCVGNDHREGTLRIPFLESLSGCRVVHSHYLLGCCVFYRGDFVRSLARRDFFPRFLALTQPFEKSFYPDYVEQGGYDLNEHLYPTLAVAMGGTVSELCHWDAAWHGDPRFPMRWRPDLEHEHPGASLLHPVKDPAHPARCARRRRDGR